MAKANKFWTTEKRKELEMLLHEGFNVPSIAKMMGVNSQSVYKEIKAAIPTEEYAAKRYLKYTAKSAEENAIKNAIRKIKGE
jgi:IS30 family transposase